MKDEPYTAWDVTNHAGCSTRAHSAREAAKNVARWLRRRSGTFNVRPIFCHHTTPTVTVRIVNGKALRGNHG